MEMDLEMDATESLVYVCGSKTIKEEIEHVSQISFPTLRKWIYTG